MGQFGCFSSLPVSAEGWEMGTELRAVLVSLQNGEASLFEVNIRYIGGLLATYYLTGEEVGPPSPGVPPAPGTS